MTSRPAIPGLDGLRGVAASGILVLHVWLYTGARAPVPPPHALDAFFNELRVGVTLFFVLSAYLLVAPWLRARRDAGPPPRAGAFWTRRAARIVPAYAVGVIASVWVAHGTRTDPGPDAWWFAVFAHNQVEGLVPVNPPLWSLGVEVSFYAVLPLLGWLLMRRGGLWATIAATVAVSLCWCWLHHTLDWPVTYLRSLPTFVGSFGVGIGAAVLAARRTPSPRACVRMIVGGCALVVLNGLWHASAFGDSAALGEVVRDLPAAIGFAAIVVGVAHRPAGWLDSLLPRVAGKLSYGVYVYHWPVLVWLIHERRLPRSTVEGVLVVGGATFALAAFSYLVLEKPCIALGRRLTRRPASQARAARPRSAATASLIDSRA